MTNNENNGKATDCKRCDFVVSEENNGDRLDVFLADVFEFSRSHIQKLAKDGLIEINGAIAKKCSKSVKIGDKVVLSVPQPKSIELLPENIPLDIVYEDEYLAVINKQQGLTVHPAGGSFSNTLVNALLYHIKDLSGINGSVRPGIVHRLDKDTSGLMLVAKNDFAHISLAEQIASKTCKRIYCALVEGVMKQDNGVVDKPIARSKQDRKKMAIDPNGKSAVTTYEVLRRFQNHTLVKFELKTGRTHQIRVHTADLGHPVVGDKTYGYKKQKFELNGQLLHSKIIEFVHPKTNIIMRFESELPDYFLQVLRVLEQKENNS